MTTVMIVLASWLALSVVASAVWSAALRRLSAGPAGRLSETHRRRWVMCGQATLLVASVAAAALTSRAADWQPAALVAVLAAFALASDAIPVPAGRYRFSAGFVAMVLAMALLGPAPAVAIGLLCAGVDGARSRPALPYLLNNLAAYAAFPLVGALLLRLFDGASPTAFAAAVAAVAVVVNLLNFLLIASHAAALDREPILPALRQTWAPVLPWELATASVTALTAYGYAMGGDVVVAFCAVALATLQVVLVAARGTPWLQPPPRIG